MDNNQLYETTENNKIIIKFFMIGLKRGTVKLVSNHEEWKSLFEHERKSLSKLLNSDIKIEHVGSTAIPCVPAKPIIDIVMGYSDDGVKKAIFKILRSCGYEDMGEKGKKNHRFFAKGPDDNRTHYIHVTKINSEVWDEYVLFRDFLLRHQGAREKYNALKIKLAKKYADKRELYTEGKSKFITDILNKAKIFL